jgi:lipid-A-disaccharide synthase
MTRKRTALIVVGEASGDRLGAGLAKALGTADPELTLMAVGGPLMEEAGCRILIPYTELMVTGLVEVLGHLPRIYRIFKRVTAILKSKNRPDVLVLIDYPEFNMRLAAKAHRLGIPVLYYVSPQVWAWRKYRTKRLAHIVDKMAVIFPFEVDHYSGLQIQVEYVGHPLLEEALEVPDRHILRKRYGYQGNPIVGLFPGSRMNELKYNLETILETAEDLTGKRRDISFIMPVAPGIKLEVIESALSRHDLDILVTRDPLAEVAKVCDAAVTVAGTATLQTALAGTPMVIIYKMAPLSYFILSRTVTLLHIGMVNIVAGKRVVKEFIQEAATPGNVSSELLKLLEDVKYRDVIKSELTLVFRKMQSSGSSMRVAHMASELSMGLDRSG